ncbi:MAG TPA: hypothetical protein VGM83_07245 [Devosiaceae bacterium]|jgi:hypothetical protein
MTDGNLWARRLKGKSPLAIELIAGRYRAGRNARDVLARITAGIGTLAQVKFAAIDDRFRVRSHHNAWLST